MVGEHDAEPGGHGKNSDRQKGDERTGPHDVAPGILTNADIHHPGGARDPDQGADHNAPRGQPSPIRSLVFLVAGVSDDECRAAASVRL